MGKDQCLPGVRAGVKVWLQRDSMREVFEVMEQLCILIIMVAKQTLVGFKVIELYILPRKMSTLDRLT